MLELEREAVIIGENTKYGLGVVSVGSWGLGGPRHWNKVPGGAGVCKCSRGVWMWHWGHGLGVVMVGLGDPEGLLQP